MLVPDLVQPLVLLGAVVALTPPLGAFIARVMSGERTSLHPVLGPVERLVYRSLRLLPDREQTWKAYAALAAGLLAGLDRGPLHAPAVQGLLPVNPDGFGAVEPYLALNTAVSFATNTNWQNYLGEATMSHLTQMAGLATQNFVSAGVGLAVAIALIRGLTRRRADTIGNFWVDLTRGVLYVLLPLSILLATVLLARGVIQNFNGLREVTGVGGAAQTLPGGPVASQEAIKELGTNGAASTTPTRPTPTRTPTRSPTSWRCWPCWRSRSPSRPPTAGWSAPGARGGRCSRPWPSSGRSWWPPRSWPSRPATRSSSGPGSTRPRPPGPAPRPAATWRARRSASASAPRAPSRPARPAPPPARSTPSTTPTPPSAGW